MAKKKTSKKSEKIVKKGSTKKVASRKKVSAKSKATSKKKDVNKQDQNITDAEDSLFWVGIGASAGGLEALRLFVSKLPKEAQGNITYIVAQHLSPTHQSMLVQLLSRETDMSILELRNGQKPQAGVMYITPPDSDVYVQNGTLYLRAPNSEFSPKPSVDLFLSTLAEDQKEHSIGVILSGTGSDGSHGVRAVRAAGGMTIAQDVKTAKFDGMPGNAIETGCVDIILSPEKMGKQIADLIESPRNLEFIQADVERTDIQELLFLLKERSGVDFKDYKTGTLYRRINRRMAACSTAGLDEYLTYIRKNPQELDELHSDILISVTNFFRDTEAFDKLKETVQEMLKDKAPGDPIRIWVPGCATGEEAYSIVILFSEALGGLAQLSAYNFQLFASDIDTDILAQARKGIYAETTLEHVDKKLRVKYFRHRENAYEIIKGVRDLVVFSKHNVFEDPPFLRLDLISCRNLLIYFNIILQEKVMHLFHYALQQNGVLFLGKSESLGNSTNLFQPIDNKYKLYRRKFITGNEKEPFTRASYTAVKRIEDTAVVTTNKIVHDLPDAVIEALSPDSLLVDENMDVVRIYGDVQAYTQLLPGSVSMNLMSLVKKDFRQEVRALVYKLLRENMSQTTLPKKMKIDGVSHQVNVVIRALSVKNVKDRLLLISFEKTKEIKPASDYEETRSNSDPIVLELEQELASTREHLQTVVEELETSNEELQSTNEELQSSNEELQSSNEELETANEELQSTNEELLTVNDELQITTHELTISNEDLNNVRDSFDFPLVVVGKELKIKLYNKASKLIFMLEEGNSVDTITSIGTYIDIPNLRENIFSVMETGALFSRQIDTNDVCYAERILPYKSEGGEVEGAILTYIDNTQTRQIEKKLKESEERYKLSVDGSSVGLWDWNVKEDVLYCSPNLMHILRVDIKKFTATFDFIESRIHSDDAKDVMDILNAHLEKSFDFNVEFRMRTGSLKTKRNSEASKDFIWVHMRGQAIWDEDNNAIRMSGSLDDVTDRRRVIEQLRDSNEALSRFAYVCSHDLREPARLAENFSDLLYDNYKSKLDEDGVEFITQIKESTMRMQDMIKDMLAYSKVENKSVILTDIDCNKEVEKVIKTLSLMIKEKKAQVTFGDLPTIKADKIQIFQLFQNLVDNGLKFCDAKIPKIHIDATEKDEGWCFSVKDNGIGMKPEHSSQIFDVFKRLHNTQDYPGTGIGLSICQKIVQRHGGKIWVESKPDKGSVFFFTLPANNTSEKKNDRIAA